jgi:hypothetical protein
MRPSTRCRDTSIRLLSTGVRCGTLPLAPRPDTHTTPQLRLNCGTLTAKKNYLRAARPLFLTDLGAAPSPLAPRPDPHDQMAEKNLVARAIRHHSKCDKGFLPLPGAQASTNTEQTKVRQHKKTTLAQFFQKKTQNRSRSVLRLLCT